MRFPKKIETENQNLYDARIIETNIIIGLAICGISAITGMKKELFMIYATCYSMHLIINTFVRLKYYFYVSDLKNILISIGKGAMFIFIPSLIIQKVVFNEFVNLTMLFTMVIALILSAIAIYIKKKKVETEDITVNNGYIHMKIVLTLTLIISGVQFIQLM